MNELRPWSSKWRCNLGTVHPWRKKKAVRKIYGIYEQPSMFADITNPFMQTIPCIGHFIDLSILLRLIDAMLSQVCSNNQSRNIFQGQLLSLELPRQWTRIKINLLSVRGKRQRYMHFVRKIGLLNSLLFDGLVAEVGEESSFPASND